VATRPLFWKLFPSYLTVMLLTLAATSWFVVRSTREFYLDHTAQELKARAVILRSQFSGYDFTSNASIIDTLCKQLGKESASRITVILPSGIVIGDTDEGPGTMENHANRPEIQSALSDGIGTSTRYSQTMHKTMMYTAMPVTSDKGLAGVVRISVPISEIEQTFSSTYTNLTGGILIIALLAGILSIVISRNISRPLVSIRLAAERFTRGEFSHPLPSGGSEEIDELARTMNKMAAQLDEKLRTITDQRNERDAVLSSMVEGVFAVDTSEKIISFNDACSQMLGLNQQSAKGRYLQEVVRVAELQQFAATILSTQSTQESEFTLPGTPTRTVQAHGAPLRGVDGRNMGAVVVLNDITRLHQLEGIRRDFVANVSHELRTPITSIKGFVETLRDGGIDDSVQSVRFLEIISRQTDRLNSIINDLLMLSELEQSSRGEVGSQSIELEKLLQGAIELVQLKADSAKLRISLQCNPGMLVDVNPPLMEQAVVNLLDNAIKYSTEASTIEVIAHSMNGQVAISVVDHGSGIERHHLPRLFERFYRVDRARSRELGGTGLGLSIVKHIVSVHGGDVSVESAPGKGSTFTITIPQQHSAIRS
jgi:two-component system, OmpR family, phosphate regulon sensor histidine kinase PhoR